MAKARKAAKRPAKRTAAKRPAAKRAAVKKTVKQSTAKAVTTSVRDKQSQAQIIADVATNAGVDRKHVRAVLEALKLQARRHLGKGGSGEMMIPGLGVKLRRVKKAARKARRGINPFTGQEMMFKAKPASQSVRASALKALKEMAG